MAFRKKYTKRVYKGTRTLKKSNIFRHKSSSSQAKQIYKLNKKVNYIQKATAPEISRFQGNVFNERLVDTSTSEAITNKNGVIPLYKDLLFDNQNVNHITLKGEMLRVRYMYLYGLFETTGSSMLGEEILPGTQRTTMQYMSVPWTAYLRIIVCRLKKSTQTVPTKITQAPDQSYSGSNNRNRYDVKPIIGPLVENISSQLSVIKDKVIKINNNNPSKMYKIKLSPKQLGYIYRKPPEGSVSETVGQNEILIYYQYVCPHLLRYVNMDTSIDKNLSPTCQFTMNINYGYIDQN